MKRYMTCDDNFVSNSLALQALQATTNTETSAFKPEITECNQVCVDLKKKKYDTQVNIIHYYINIIKHQTLCCVFNAKPMSENPKLPV